MKIPYVFKVCSKCHTILLATTDNFYRKKNGKYGLYAKCKKCEAKDKEAYMKTYSKAYYEAHKEKEKARNKTYREAHKEERKAYMKTYNKTYREAHKEERKAYDKAYYEANKEEIKARDKAYRKAYRETHKEEKRAYDKVYREAHKEELKARSKAYRQSEQGQVVAFNSYFRRTAKLASNGGKITKDQWLECLKYFNFTCAYSGEKLTNNTRSLDHIIAVNNGGSNNVWNVCPMLRSLNSSKKDKCMEEWYQEQDFYSEERLAKIYEWIEYSKSKYEKVEVTI